jgi:hypothetical protein
VVFIIELYGVQQPELCLILASVRPSAGAHVMLQVRTAFLVKEIPRRYSWDDFLFKNKEKSLK